MGGQCLAQAALDDLRHAAGAFGLQDDWVQSRQRLCRARLRQKHPGLEHAPHFPHQGRQAWARPAGGRQACPNRALLCLLDLSRRQVQADLGLGQLSHGGNVVIKGAPGGCFFQVGERSRHIAPGLLQPGPGEQGAETGAELPALPA